ncbi:effector protein Tle3 domain-containing protein [Janthinobacterium fluminis]|uniref:DUF3274 domain-containing protein n=1 Tax=Janthinobacterium fluminis TaxID=2987524 RepID=A0ABT5JX65_9BURK|nr:DUF3274 domain-containing protein [Janthinobacterium fluminis]MDC8757071.1 DUF3274 domain-containing protein [Janthinobacterium fluminis]
MSEDGENRIVMGKQAQWLLPGGGNQYVPLTRPAPCLVILVHGVNDIGEAFPYQEQGICAGLNTRLDRGEHLEPANYVLPLALGEGQQYKPEDIHPDPDKVYFARSSDSTTSPVIPFLWGFREDTNKADTQQKHGEYLDRYGNRIDKRYAKNGGPFVNATTNIPDMFGPGFKRNWTIRRADPESPTHPMLDAPPRHYMVLAAQRLAALIRIIRRQSPAEPINIVAHSQGCFVSLLAHAILAAEKGGIKADTLILNNWPYSVDQPALEQLQTDEAQQSVAAREATLLNIIKDFITHQPASEPKFAALRELGEGVVGPKWRHDANKERDNRGKVYLYFSPDDLTVGLGNIEGIGWWGVYDGMLERLGGRFLQRAFASPAGPTKGAPDVGSAPHPIRLSFTWNIASQMTAARNRRVNGEELPQPFQPELGKATLAISPIDAAVAVANPYLRKDNVGMRAGESPAEAKARWLGTFEKNSWHSSIVSNPMHSEKATAYDLCIGVSGILKDGDLTWIRFLRAVADWRTNWFGKASDFTNNKKNPSYSPPPLELLTLLNDAGLVAAADREIINGNYNYYCISESEAGALPDFTMNCTVKSVQPYVVSEIVGEVNSRKKETENIYGGA